MSIGKARATFITSYGLVIASLFLAGCGPNTEEVQRIAAVACAQIEASREFESAMRVRLINEAREKIGGEPYLSGDQQIRRAVSYGICTELVLGDDEYDAALEIVLERERALAELRAKQRAEEEARQAKQRAEEEARQAKQRAEEQARQAKQRAEEKARQAKQRAEEKAEIIGRFKKRPQCSAMSERENMPDYSAGDRYDRLVFITQEYLRDLEFEVGEVNGDLNNLTKRAIRQYQAAMHLTQSGLVSNNLLVRIEKNWQVVRTQGYLKELGFEVGEVNGDLNNLPTRAIRQYQAAMDLNESGLVSNTLLMHIEKTFKIVCL